MTAVIQPRSRTGPVAPRVDQRRFRPLSVYVASSARNERFPSVIEALRQAGHRVYDFKAQPTFFPWQEVTGAGVCDAAAQRAALSHPRAQRALLKDMIGLLEADACVLVLPAGASSHIELGVAVGAKKRTVVLLAEGEPELMYRMATSVCTSVEEVVNALRAPGDPR